MKFAGIEHKWEKITNVFIVVGIIVTFFFYYYDIGFSFFDVFVSTGEVGLFFLVLVGICHLIARLGHMGEQHYLKDNRPWRK